MHNLFQAEVGSDGIVTVDGKKYWSEFLENMYKFRQEFRDKVLKGCEDRALCTAPNPCFCLTVIPSETVTVYCEVVSDDSIKVLNMDGTLLGHAIEYNTLVNKLKVDVEESHVS